MEVKVWALLFDFERKYEKKIVFQVKLNQFLSYGKFLVVQKPKWFPMVGDKKKNSMHPLIEKTYKIGNIMNLLSISGLLLGLWYDSLKQNIRKNGEKKCICTIPFELLLGLVATLRTSHSGYESKLTESNGENV